MALWYEEPRPTETKLLAQVLSRYHPALVRSEVHVRLLRACRDDGQPAVRCNGAPAAARISKLGHLLRLLAGADALIEIDALDWEQRPADQRAALLDHELTHLVLVEDAHGQVKQHRDGRPQLKLRHDDWVLTGFHEVIQRHGGAALEARSIRDVADQNQRLLEFMRTAHEPRLVQAEA